MNPYACNTPSGLRFGSGAPDNDSSPCASPFDIAYSDHSSASSPYHGASPSSMCLDPWSPAVHLEVTLRVNQLMTHRAVSYYGVSLGRLVIRNLRDHKPLPLLDEILIQLRQDLRITKEASILAKSALVNFSSQWRMQVARYEEFDQEKLEEQTFTPRTYEQWPGYPLAEITAEICRDYRALYRLVADLQKGSRLNREYRLPTAIFAGISTEPKRCNSPA